MISVHADVETVGPSLMDVAKHLDTYKSTLSTKNCKFLQSCTAISMHRYVEETNCEGFWK